MEVEGKLISLLEIQQGTGKNGNWQKQDFVIETFEKFPKKVCLNVWGDKVDTLKDFKVGDNIKASINIESREYNGRWYTDIRAWRLEKAGENVANTSSAGNSDIPPPDFSSDNNSSEITDDLPF